GPVGTQPHQPPGIRRQRTALGGGCQPQSGAGPAVAESPGAGGGWGAGAGVWGDIDGVLSGAAVIGRVRSPAATAPESQVHDTAPAAPAASPPGAGSPRSGSRNNAGCSAHSG